MTEQAAASGYTFGQFALYPTERSLLLNGQPVSVSPRAFDVLVALVERAGRLVSKNELLDLVWPNLVVEENNLQAHVSALRKILGHQAITTIQGRGYRFALTPELVAADLPLSPEPRKHNLPRQLTSFVGRQKEIAEVKALLIRARLLTLTGASGCGKTRLGLQVAADALEHFPDGTWFVDLAPLSDPALVPQAVATVLGMKEEQGKPNTPIATQRFARKRLLLVLDNCEHLLEACAKVADALVQQYPGVHILATSREALGIAGEQTYRMPSLTLPDWTEAQTPQGISSCESIQLFVERARLVRPDFQVTQQNARALALLCRHLDGIPLAIELAAARVRMFTVEEINGKLDQSFRILTGGCRTAPPRHQTLRSLVDWSYHLLNDPEKRLLQRLSVFSGGWTLDAAERVCFGEGVTEDDVLELLSSLSDQNLVLAEQANGHTRYRLLETMRQYARQRLLESRGGEAIRGRHRDYFLTLSEETEPKLCGADQADWLRRLEAEHDNLRAALDWCLVDAGSNAGLRFCGALQRFWWMRGHQPEGREWCRRFLSQAECGQPAMEHAKALNAAGVLARYECDYAAARTWHEGGLSMWRQLGDRRGVALSLTNLGNVIYEQGDLDTARVLFEECLANMRELEDRGGIARSLKSLGDVACNQGEHAAARLLLVEGLAIMRELGDQGGIAGALSNLGELACTQNDYPAAQAYFEECLAIRRELGDRSGIAYSMGSLGNVACVRGDLASARTLCERGLVIQHELGDSRGIARLLEGLAAVVTAFGGFLRAARIWGAAERLREAIGSLLPPSERTRYHRRVAAARIALRDGASFDGAWLEGRALTLEQAIELALDGRVQPQ